MYRGRILILFVIAAVLATGIGVTASADTVNIVVVTETGKTMTFPVESDQKVSELKALISDVATISPGNQRLYTGSVELMYNNRIGEYSLAEGDTIRCRLGTGGVIYRNNPLKKVIPWLAWIAGIAAFVYVSKRWIFVRPQDEDDDDDE